MIIEILQIQILINKLIMWVEYKSIKQFTLKEKL